MKGLARRLQRRRLPRGKRSLHVDPTRWTAEESRSWALSASLEMGAAPSSASRLADALAVRGRELCLLTREDFEGAAPLVPPSSLLPAALFRRLELARSEALFVSEGGQVFSKSLALHGRLLDEGEPLPDALTSPVEREAAGRLADRFKALRAAVRRDEATGFVSVDSLAEVAEEAAAWLRDELPPSHPLAVKEGRYHFTAQRRAAVRRVLKAVVARHGGYRGAGGVCAALSDAPGSGKTLTLKLCATVSALLLERVLPFYHDCRDAPRAPSELHRVAYRHRTGREPPHGINIFTDQKLVSVGFLDEAHLMWRRGAGPGSPHARAVREVYYQGAHPSAGALFLAGPADRLDPLVRGGEHGDGLGAYPSGLGADQYEPLRLGALRTRDGLEAFVRRLGDDGAVPPAPLGRALADLGALYYRTGGVPRRVVNALLDDRSPEPGPPVRLPAADSLEMALLFVLHGKRRGDDLQPAWLGISEALRVNKAYASASASASAPASAAPPLVTDVMRGMEDKYLLAEEPAGSRRYRLFYPSLRERLAANASDLFEPLARAAPALFLDPFWRRAPEGSLREAVRRRSAVFVLGAGVSMATAPASAPSWPELVARASAALLGEGSRGRVALCLERGAPAEAATLVHREADPAALAAFFRREMGALRPSSPRLLRAIGRTGLPVVTTNYDNLLADVLGRRSAVWTDERLPAEEILRGEAVDLYVHGRWDVPESLVLGADSYRRVLSDSRVQSLLRGLHSGGRTLVYVGVGDGLDDPNFGRLLRWADDTLRDADYRQFVLMREEDGREWAARQGAQRSQTTHTLPVIYGSDFSDLPGFVEELCQGA